jgi:hypothetical protein
MGEIEVIFWRKFISIELKGTIQPEKRTKMGDLTLGIKQANKANMKQVTSYCCETGLLSFIGFDV